MFADLSCLERESAAQLLKDHFPDLDLTEFVGRPAGPVVLDAEQHSVASVLHTPDVQGEGCHKGGGLQ